MLAGHAVGVKSMFLCFTRYVAFILGTKETSCGKYIFRESLKHLEEVHYKFL